MFRQDPGGDFNSLGVVRINIANPYGVYMHDTPAKGIFGDDFRFVSSGCMRVQNVRDYVDLAAQGHARLGSRPDRRSHPSGERVDAKIMPPVPVYWVYVTAWATPEGVAQFRDDIYKRDGFGDTGGLLAAQPSPVAQNTRPVISGASDRRELLNEDDDRRR